MILDRYLARTYARIALSTFLAIVAVVLVIDFADRAYSFRGEGWFQNMLRLYANLAIDLGYQAAPSAFLVAAGITVSSLRAQGEYVAFLALGNRPGRLIAVLLGTVSVFCLGLLVLHETVAADAARRAEEIKIRDFRRPQNIGAYFQQSQWFRSGKWVYNLREREGAGFRNVTLYELGDDFSLVRRIDAEAMLPKSDGWRFEHARVASFRAGELQGIEEGEALELELPERPEDFQLRTGRPRHLPLRELLAQIRLRQRLGLEDVGYRQELFRRVAFPFSAVPASLVAIRLAMRRNRRGHLATSLGEGILLSLLLWTLFTIFQAFGLSGAISPAVSGLAPLAVFFVLGLGLGVFQDLSFRRRVEAPSSAS
ncbi:MAG TPA: LptF/LptG family permease [Fredinandcohnia sp.]|nr:LptF/LptG family permease [Fredinandcohnia sp.]